MDIAKRNELIFALAEISEDKQDALRYRTLRRLALAQLDCATAEQPDLAVDLLPVDGSSTDWLDFVMEGRRLACDQRYRERLRPLNRLFSMAA